MIYDGIINKPPMEEIIEHGWVKDAAAKVHKYLKRWKNKAGKWVYQYTKPKNEGPTDRSASLSKSINGYSDREAGIARYHIYKDRKRQIEKARNNARVKTASAMRKDPPI